MHSEFPNFTHYMSSNAKVSLLHSSLLLGSKGAKKPVKSPLVSHQRRSSLPSSTPPSKPPHRQQSASLSSSFLSEESFADIDDVREELIEVVEQEGSKTATPPSVEKSSSAAELDTAAAEKR